MLTLKQAQELELANKREYGESLTALRGRRCSSPGPRRRVESNSAVTAGKYGGEP